MKITGVTAGSVYDTYAYAGSTTESQEEVQTITQEVEVVKSNSANASVSELFEAQQGAAGSVNITQAGASGTGTQTTTQSSSDSEEEEETVSVKMVYNADGSIEQVTTTTDADGNETVERVQISGPTEEKAASGQEEQSNMSRKMQKAIESYTGYTAV